MLGDTAKDATSFALNLAQTATPHPVVRSDSMGIQGWRFSSIYMYWKHAKWKCIDLFCDKNLNKDSFY